MKQPKIIKKEHIKCIVCKKPIHIDELAAITKDGMYHDNTFCLLGLIKKDREDEK